MSDKDSCEEMFSSQDSSSSVEFLGVYESAHHSEIQIFVPETPTSSNRSSANQIGNCSQLSSVAETELDFDWRSIPETTPSSCRSSTQNTVHCSLPSSVAETDPDCECDWPCIPESPISNFHSSTHQIDNCSQLSSVAETDLDSDWRSIPESSEHSNHSSVHDTCVSRSLPSSVPESSPEL